MVAPTGRPPQMAAPMLRPPCGESPSEERNHCDCGPCHRGNARDSAGVAAADSGLLCTSSSPAGRVAGGVIGTSRGLTMRVARARKSSGQPMCRGEAVVGREARGLQQAPLNLPPAVAAVRDRPLVGRGSRGEPNERRSGREEGLRHRRTADGRAIAAAGGLLQGIPLSIARGVMEGVATIGWPSATAATGHH